MYTEMQGRFLTPEQVADRLGISVRAVREKVYQGKWPHLRLDGRTMRFTEEHVLEIVRSSAQPGSVTPASRSSRDAAKELAALLRRR